MKSEIKTNIKALKDSAKIESYLTPHGHFYQPPRENPWLEAIELQDSALPFHDWNERIDLECYTPNSVSRIVDSENKVLDIVNNYSLMSFNFGPTLLSWLEEKNPRTYERIIKANRKSMEQRNGHGNAIAQVYNHLIMPLANEQDKQTQVKWGKRDFEHRFGVAPEGMWLGETAVDDDTLRVLRQNGIKFTILSPHQALKVRPIEKIHNEEHSDKCWCDVSWGSIDPARAYRYFIKDGSGEYIDLFFYDGAISKSVAFDNLLKDGEKFIKRLKDGVSDTRNYSQLINISTDGESYGHHTKFGDMALSYILKIKAEEVGLRLTNYGEFLEFYPPTYEVDIKEGSSWSCCHGVGRWKEDCGCSTGAKAGWNQKWRKPLREGLNWLRDKLDAIYRENIKEYLKDPIRARNNYINVILNRSEESVANFINEEKTRELSNEEISSALKLLEIQRMSMLMFTSCGWFFADISGIETTQIMKYAARAMQLAEDFSSEDLEAQFLTILDEAKSNIREYGTGKDLYLRFVKPSIVSIQQVVNHWAISSLFEDYENEVDLFCYQIKIIDHRKIQKAKTQFAMGRLEVYSKITHEKHYMSFALLHFSGEDFHCSIKSCNSNACYNKLKKQLLNAYENDSLTEIIRALDEHYGKNYYTLKDLFVEERRKIINILIEDNLNKFSSTLKRLYEDSKDTMGHLRRVDLKIPNEFKIVAEYVLSRDFNDSVKQINDFVNDDEIERLMDVQNQADKLAIKLQKGKSKRLFGNFLRKNLELLAMNMECKQANYLVSILKNAEKTGISANISEAQNIFFNQVMTESNFKKAKEDKRLLEQIIELGRCLNINVEKLENSAKVKEVISPQRQI